MDGKVSLNVLFWHRFTEFAFQDDEFSSLFRKDEQPNKSLDKNWKNLNWDGPLSPEPVHIVIRVKDYKLTAELYIRAKEKELLKVLEDAKTEMEEISGLKLDLKSTRGKNDNPPQAFKISAHKNILFKKDESEYWEEHFVWFMDTATRLKSAFEAVAL